MKKYTHEKAHEEIDYIFKTLLPQRGMAERPEQIRLCHSILDAMLDGSIALCDAGTGIGKTFAYLTAGILHGKCRAAEGRPQRPILISTSSIALQNAIQKEYLPLLRFAVSATGGAHLCSIQYYLRFWLSSCRTSLAVSALRIMRYCPKK